MIRTQISLCRTENLLERSNLQKIIRTLLKWLVDRDHRGPAMSKTLCCVQFTLSLADISMNHMSMYPLNPEAFGFTNEAPKMSQVKVKRRDANSANPQLPKSLHVVHFVTYLGPTKPMILLTMIGSDQFVKSGELIIASLVESKLLRS